MGISPDRVQETIENIPVGDLCGVGKKLQKQLALCFNVHTCGELGRISTGIGLFCLYHAANHDPEHPAGGNLLERHVLSIAKA